MFEIEEYWPNQTQFRLRPIYENGNGILQLTRAVLLISNTKSKIQPMYCLIMIKATLKSVHRGCRDTRSKITFLRTHNYIRRSFNSGDSLQAASSPPGSIWPTSSPTSSSMSRFSLLFIVKMRSPYFLRSIARLFISNGSLLRSNSSTSLLANNCHRVLGTWCS